MSTDNTSLIARANLKEAEAAITEFDRVQAGISLWPIILLAFSTV